VSESAPSLRAACFGRDLHRDGWPTVSVVVPVRNEAPHLERAVASILAQEYPVPFDVCLAVAPSDDDTAAMAARLAATNDRVAVVDNPAGITPAGLNCAIAATDGSIVVRVDGHAELSDGYIRRAVETMCRTGAVNVGGMQVPKPQTPFEKAVAAATTSWMGTGGATYRLGGAEGPVDTVYLGVFDRTAGDAVGWFDESLIRNQDYELNIRLRKAGGQVWFDPRLSVGYRPRSSWTALAKQYYEYGWWKAAVVRRHPDSLRLRQVAPASLPMVLALATLRAVRRPSSLLVPAAYAGIVAICSIGRSRPVRTAAITATMQTCWGVGFWSGFCDRRGSATGP
jgi:glycosyltransferase involved in cell wall biosynthesis